MLPTKKTAANKSPERLKYFIMAEPKWGKTTFFCGVEDALLLAFEEGHAFVEAYKIVIDKWDANQKERKAGTWFTDEDGNTHTTAEEAIEELERQAASPEGLPYKFIIVDTADMASKMCTDYACAQAGVTHPADGGEWGKGFATLQTDPFRKWFGRLVKLGVGIACISHTKVTDIKEKNKIVGQKRESTLPSGIQKFIHTQADVIINGYFGRRRKGMDDRDRIISFDGSNEVLAGSRIKLVHIPKKYIVAPPSANEPNASWEQWQSFFEDSPKAGRAAEAEYAKLILGKDDEQDPTSTDNTPSPSE